MAGELKHKSPGAKLTRPEYENIDAHIVDGQATGDILYASSATQWVKLAKGSDDDILTLASGIPAWVASVALASAFSCMWYHGVESTTTISAQATLHQITDFVNVGEEDPNGNVVADPVTDNDLVIGANGAGVYAISATSSFRNSGGGSTDMLFCPGIELATPIAIASSTDATPIVVETSGAHGLESGDMVRVAGHTTNVALNRDAMITRVDSDHFSVQDLGGVDVAGSGSGAGAGGSVTVKFPGNCAVHRIVSQTNLGRGAAYGSVRLAVGDAVQLYCADLDGTDDMVSVQHNLDVDRRGS